jgi:hypothetical protein
MKCTYCGNAVVIPESMRSAPETAASPQVSIFSGIDMNAMVGYGAQWSEVIQLAQNGSRDEAVQKYMALTGNGESSARYMVDNLSGTQFYDTMTGGQAYAPYMKTVAETVKTTTRWSLWLGCGITAFVMCIILVTVIPTLVGVFASIWASFR